MVFGFDVYLINFDCILFYIQVSVCSCSSEEQLIFFKGWLFVVHRQILFIYFILIHFSNINFVRNVNITSNVYLFLFFRCTPGSLFMSRQSRNLAWHKQFLLKYGWFVWCQDNGFCWSVPLLVWVWFVCLMPCSEPVCVGLFV